jgi:hypothetical protein
VSSGWWATDEFRRLVAIKKARLSRMWALQSMRDYNLAILERLRAR